MVGGDAREGGGASSGGRGRGGKGRETAEQYLRPVGPRPGVPEVVQPLRRPGELPLRQLIVGAEVPVGEAQEQALVLGVTDGLHPRMVGRNVREGGGGGRPHRPRSEGGRNGDDGDDSIRPPFAFRVAASRLTWSPRSIYARPPMAHSPFLSYTRMGCRRYVVVPVRGGLKRIKRVLSHRPANMGRGRRAGVGGRLRKLWKNDTANYAAGCASPSPNLTNRRAGK